MPSRRDTIDAVLFLPAMLLLAGLVFGIFAGIIVAAGWLFEAISVVLEHLLPRPLTFALTVLSVAAIVTAVGTGALNGWGRRKP